MKKPNISLLLIFLFFAAFIPGHISRLKHHQQESPIGQKLQNVEVQIQATFNNYCVSYETNKTLCLMVCDPQNKDQIWIIKPKLNTKFPVAHVIVPKSNEAVYLNLNKTWLTEPSLGSFDEKASLWQVTASVEKYSSIITYYFYNLNTGTSLACFSKDQNPQNPVRVYSWNRFRGQAGSKEDSFFIVYAIPGLSYGYSKFQTFNNKISVVQIQVSDWFGNIIPCLEYNNNSKKLDLARCDPDNVNQRWSIFREASNNRFTISTGSNKKFFLTTVGDYPSSPSVAEGRDFFSDWALVDDTNTYGDMWTFVNLKRDVNLQFCKNNKPGLALQTGRVSGYCSQVFYFREAVLGGIDPKFENKWVSVKWGYLKNKCLSIPSYSSYLIMEDCRKENILQRFKFVPREGGYIIKNQGYENKTTPNLQPCDPNRWRGFKEKAMMGSEEFVFGVENFPLKNSNTRFFSIYSKEGRRALEGNRDKGSFMFSELYPPNPFVSIPFVLSTDAWNFYLEE